MKTDYVHVETRAKSTVTFVVLLPTMKFNGTCLGQNDKTCMFVLGVHIVLYNKTKDQTSATQYIHFSLNEKAHICMPHRKQIFGMP